MTRTEVGQDGVGEMAVEHLGCPGLPGLKHSRQVAENAGQCVRLEQGHARRRRTGACLEHDHGDFTSLERRVQREQQRQHRGEQAQARRGRDQRNQPRPAAGCDVVAEAQGQQRGAGEVQGCGEVLGRGPNLVAHGIQQQAVAEDQPGDPADEQQDDCQSTEAAEKAFAAFSEVDAQADPAPEFP